MQTRSGAEIVVDGDVVYKLHRPGTDPRALATRLRIAAESGSLLTPLDTNPEPVGMRWRTRWPRVETVVPQPECAPWADAGRLLAQLHGEAMPRADAAARLAAAAAARCRHRGPTMTPSAARRPSCHPRCGGPAHRTGRRRWCTATGISASSADDPRSSRGCCIDIDDLGVGDPAWDLARPAGFWAAGLIPDDDWATFLDAYRDAGGPALPPVDPWPVLEPFARAAVVQAAAHHPDDELLLAACARMF